MLDDTNFTVYGAPRGDAKLADVEAAVDAEIARIVKDGVTDEELEKAKNRYVRSMIFARDKQVEHGQHLWRDAGHRRQCARMSSNGRTASARSPPTRSRPSPPSYLGARPLGDRLSLAAATGGELMMTNAMLDRRMLAFLRKAIAECAACWRLRRCSMLFLILPALAARAEWTSRR